MFGKPRSVRSSAHCSAHGYVDHTTTSYDYADGKIVTADSSFAAADSLVWDAAARVFFEKATVYLGGMYKSPLTVYPDGGKPFSPKLGSRSGYEEEIRYFLSLVEGRAPKNAVLTARDARESMALVLAERRSAETGKAVRI